MVATDPNPGGKLTFATPVQVDGFQLHPDGSFTFDPSHAAYQQLPDGQTRVLTVPVTVTDSTGLSTTENLTIEITGTNDVAVVTGTAVGQVTEDTQLTASGTLTVTDPDAGQAEFVPQPSAAGTYGSFAVDANGQWSYTLDNTDPKVQGLTSTDQLTDTIIVSTKDGTTQQITVTINGTDDKATIGGTAVGTVTEDQQLTAAGSLTTTGGDGSSIEFRADAFGPGYLRHLCRRCQRPVELHAR